MEPKDFRQRRPNGKGWTWNLNGVRKVLYRLPDVLKANVVLVVEGEKDADNVSAVGLCATTCPMGAGKWRDEYSEALKGKTIALIPDNDNQGREHMAKVGASLDGTVKNLRWVELPDLPSKGDVSDWLKRYPDKQEAFESLLSLIDKAGFYEPPKQRGLDDVVLSIHDFCSLDIPAKGTFLFPWLKENSINLISGWRGTGKTWFALGLLNAVSKSEAFGPWECMKGVPCLFLDGEMPPGDISERFQSLGIQSNGSTPLYVYSDALANNWGLPRAHLTNDSWRQKMRQILLTKRVKLWVVDNLASLASGLDENKKQDWDPINQWLLELRFAGISTVMLHHVNKDGGQRGTSAREDNLDISLILKPPHDYTPEDGARFVVHFSKARTSTRDLQLITDTEFKLTTDEAGRYVWTWGSVRRENRRTVLQMLNEGMKQTEIVDALGLSKGQVSKIKTQAAKDGLITTNGKLSQSGLTLLAEG
jgi:putative DNA primase/helicase